MSKESHAEQPLLYINQPEVEKVMVSMQSDYISSKDISDDVEKTKDKLLKETSIKEKLEQVLMTLKYVPTLKCSIETDDHTYTALLKQFDGEDVTFIDFHTKEKRIIPFANIKKVKTISF